MITIREYKTEDFDQLLDIMKLNIPQYFHTDELEDYRNYLNDGYEDYYVVAVGEKVVGAGGVNYFHDNKEARLSWDFLLPDYQGQGIGRQLIKHRLDHIIAQNVFDKVIVRTSQFAFEFYEKSGFVLKEIYHDFWAEGYDMYNMMLKLNR